MMLESYSATANFIVSVAIVYSLPIQVQHNHSLEPAMVRGYCDSCRGELYGNDPHF
jgi:hypothetical protein